MNITVLVRGAPDGNPVMGIRERLIASEYGMAIVRLRDVPADAQPKGPVLEVTVQLTLLEDGQPQLLLVMSAAEAMGLGSELYNAGRQAAVSVEEADGDAGVPEPIQNGVTTHRIDEDDDGAG